jgi:hypothetical protein
MVQERELVYYCDVYKQTRKLSILFTIHFNIDSKINEKTMQNFRLLMERYIVAVGLV